LRHLRRVREFRFVRPHLASRALRLHNVLPLLRHLVLPRRLQEQVREQVLEQRDPLAVLLRKGRDFQLVPVVHRLVDSRVRAHLRIFVLQLHLAKRVLAGLALVCHCAQEADLQEDILSAPAAAPANEVADPDKDLSADNVPAQPAELEFQRPNPASRFMRASRPRRAAVRSLRSVTRKVNANFIRCAPARVQVLDGRRKLNPSRRCNASPGK
jgi:hypothetical protein